jgi:hypothetical protein
VTLMKLILKVESPPCETTPHDDSTVQVNMSGNK